MLAVVAGLVLHVTPVAESRVGSVLSVIAGMTTSNATDPAMLQFLALNCLMRCNHARSSSRVRHFSSRVVHVTYMGHVHESCDKLSSTAK